jgi:hypothetical protein
MSRGGLKCAVFVLGVLSPLLLWAPKQLMYLVFTIGWICACALFADKVVDHVMKNSRE